MEIDTYEFRKRIYELVDGELDLKRYPVPESEFVKSEFEVGSQCLAAYSEMLSAYSRVCERLGAEEWDDCDVEIIIDNLRGIGRHLALKLFEYGVFFARREQQLSHSERYT